VPFAFLVAQSCTASMHEFTTDYGCTPAGLHQVAQILAKVQDAPSAETARGARQNDLEATSAATLDAAHQTRPAEPQQCEAPTSAKPTAGMTSAMDVRQVCDCGWQASRQAGISPPHINYSAAHTEYSALQHRVCSALMRAGATYALHLQLDSSFCE
jgi:hypothetical protein